MKSEFEIAITQLCSDRNLSAKVILEAIEGALVSAYKRNYGANQNITVRVDPHSGQAQVFLSMVVADPVTDEHMEISLAEAQKRKADAVVGDTVITETMPSNFGRIAAQTAKQVIMQRIREAERDSVYLEYADRAGEIVNGVVRNIDAHSQNVTLSLGKAEAVLARTEQIPGEHYRFNQRVRVYVVEVERTGHGPQISVSRTHRGLLRRLLELEVPEIHNGTVEVKAIAREPGSRSKVAVAALQAGIDPVGSCVGMRGVRIMNIVNELNGEKIDVVAWSADMGTFIGNALSPAKAVSARLNEQEKTAKVVVPDKSLSLAIGKEGQNARLAAKLTGWRIDIKSETEAADEAVKYAAEAEEAALRAKELDAARQAAAELLAEAQASLDEEERASLATPEEAALEAAPLAQAAAVVEEAASAEEAVAAVEAIVAGDIAATLAEGEAVAASDAAVAPIEGEAAEEWTEEVVESEEGDEDDEAKRKKGLEKKNRQRTLQFDERLGRVVARKKRKPSRQQDWTSASGDDDD
jgi:N utilization substance protein A